MWPSVDAGHPGAEPVTRLPLPTLLAVWVCLLLAGWLVVGVRTQPHAPQERCGVIVGLVLDGGPTTTTTPRSTIGRPVESIPYRRLGDPAATTTTTEACR